MEDYSSLAELLAVYCLTRRELSGNGLIREMHRVLQEGKILKMKKFELIQFLSQSLETSMLLGVNVFDFSGVRDDPCTSSLDTKVLKIKMTACGSGQFTCDDGQCVTMDERCNQISNCRLKYF